jgi:Arc/MetJ-type ribon-helix-helix transcriptional regulator
MPSKKPSAPLTFDLPESLIAKIEKARTGHGLSTASELVRLALARYNLRSFQPSVDPHRQISVRIEKDTRQTLKRVAREKDASVGELIRAALEALPVKKGR